MFTHIFCGFTLVKCIAPYYRSLLRYRHSHGQFHFQRHGHYISEFFWTLGPRFIYLHSVNLKSFAAITFTK